MNNIVISVGAVTYAIKLKKLLLRNKIYARIVKVENDNGGCTHGVEINEEDFYHAVVIMKENAIAYTIKNNIK